MSKFFGIALGIVQREQFEAADELEALVAARKARAEIEARLPGWQIVHTQVIGPFPEADAEVGWSPTQEERSDTA